MSGTSADGIDAALLELPGWPALGDFAARHGQAFPALTAFPAGEPRGRVVAHTDLDPELALPDLDPGDYAADLGFTVVTHAEDAALSAGDPVGGDGGGQLDTEGLAGVLVPGDGGDQGGLGGPATGPEAKIEVADGRVPADCGDGG